MRAGRGPPPSIQVMQLPEQPPPPLAPLWDRVIRAQALPPDLDVNLLYIAIRDRLVHPEWEVRLHALRVLADLLPLSGNALSFPFDQVVDNLGHSSPNVRKAALDALKVFCSHCEDPDCAARAILDKCCYNNIRPQSANIDTKVNVITGLILSIPSVMGILKRRHPMIDTYPIFEILGEKLFDPAHRNVAHRSLLKLRRVCGPRDYMIQISRLDPKVQHKFRYLCETYDEDSQDVYYAPIKNNYRENNQQMVTLNHVFNPQTTPVRISSSSSSNESLYNVSYHNSNSFRKVILQTEIKFDSETAITMTVLEDNETESDKNIGSEDDYDSSDKNVLKYSDEESENTDVIVKKVRFGGESFKIRTPDSENQVTSEEDTLLNNKKNYSRTVVETNGIIKEDSRSTEPDNVTKSNENTDDNLEKGSITKQLKKSGIPLPVIHTNKPRNKSVSTSYTNVKFKSKSLNELYAYFRSKNDKIDNKLSGGSGFSLTVSEARSPEKVPSPIEPHREVEVLHNLQRGPAVSPERKETRLRFQNDGFTLNLLTSSAPNLNEASFLSPRPPSPLKDHYDWEDLEVVPKHVSNQLHNTDNWIAAVKAADHLHNTLLKDSNLAKVEPAALSLVEHMWALSNAVPACRAPAEGAVCALFRGASNECARQLLPALIFRIGRDPCPAALAHALLQRVALHHLVDLLFDPHMIGVRSSDTERLEEAQLRATLCLARAAGPAAVLSAVRRRLAHTHTSDIFCSMLRERLSRPPENFRPYHVAKTNTHSQLPLPVRRRARSTPACTTPLPPRRLRPLPDSAPLLGNSSTAQVSRDRSLRRFLSPIPLSDRDSSGYTSYNGEKRLEENKTLDSVFGDQTYVDIPADEVDSTPPTPARSPSIQVEDYSDKTNPSIRSSGSRNESAKNFLNEFGSQKSLNAGSLESPISSRSRSRKSNPSPVPSKNRSPTISPVKSISVKSAKSGNLTPEPTSNTYEEPPPVCERDVRNALSECIIPAKNEDWEAIVKSLLELERLTKDSSARAPAASWRAVVRSVSGHVRSLRSRVARAACSTLGALFEHRGRALDPELEDAAQALLERCADVNRFLRADAATALVRIAIWSNSARAAVALSRRGASHRAGPVRAAAAQALAKLVEHNGPTRILDMPTEARTVFLRAAGELLGDANAETRAHARLLCQALTQDIRFHPMLKEAMPPNRYRAIEKFVDKLCLR